MAGFTARADVCRHVRGRGGRGSVSWVFGAPSRDCLGPRTPTAPNTLLVAVIAWTGVGFGTVSRGGPRSGRSGRRDRKRAFPRGLLVAEGPAPGLRRPR